LHAAGLGWGKRLAGAAIGGEQEVARGRLIRLVDRHARDAHVGVAGVGHCHPLARPDRPDRLRREAWRIGGQPWSDCLLHDRDEAAV
jgi:hypothetical protein